MLLPFTGNKLTTLLKNDKTPNSSQIMEALGLEYHSDYETKVNEDTNYNYWKCGDNIFNTADCEALLPIVQQDAYAGLLFGEEPVYDIAVDGADRKWIATHHGVWLISADGQKVIYRFTKSNSHLLSDVVHHIVLNKENGEVFFLTDWGICSFRGTAIEPDIVKQKVIVFPNPV